MNVDSSFQVTDLDQGNFQPTVSADGIVLVYCWAASCGACRQFGPVYARVAAGHPGHTFAKLDTISQSELAKSLGVAYVPALLLYRDGILLFQQAGNFDAERLEDIIAQAEGLDMAAVRADIEASSATVADTGR
jgi:thioredoxin 1